LKGIEVGMRNDLKLNTLADLSDLKNEGENTALRVQLKANKGQLVNPARGGLLVMVIYKSI
jgi:hypothetical protein